jgi:hypothetical protein
MRIAGSPCARFTALDAIVGKVINSTDSVSIVKIIPTARPPVSRTTSLTAVPSVAVSKGQFADFHFVWHVHSAFLTRKFESLCGIRTPFLLFPLSIRRAETKGQLESMKRSGRSSPTHQAGVAKKRHRSPGK